MRWFRRWYGANPLHLLVMCGCATFTGYVAGALLQVKATGVLIWFGGAIVGHDLVLLPLYVLADRPAVLVFRHRPNLPTVPWVNYLRVPTALSGMLLLLWFPLIFRIPSHFPRTTDLSLNPYLGHWLGVTGVLYLLSAVALAFRLRPGRRRRNAAGHGRDTAGQVYAEQSPVREVAEVADARDLEIPRARHDGGPPWSQAGEPGSREGSTGGDPYQQSLLRPPAGR